LAELSSPQALSSILYRHELCSTVLCEK